MRKQWPSWKRGRANSPTEGEKFQKTIKESTEEAKKKAAEARKAAARKEVGR
jgi:hypothetical protein